MVIGPIPAYEWSAASAQESAASAFHSTDSFRQALAAGAAGRDRKPPAHAVRIAPIPLAVPLRLAAKN